MGIYTFPVMLVGGIGLLAGVILAAASKFFAVEVDERVTKIRECLPGANCGGCGFAGCDDYAANLIANPDLPTNLCPVGGAAVAQKISEIMGVSFEAATPKHAVVHCNGTCQNTKYAIDYEGPQTCAACNTMFGGRGTCNFGCIGFGDCVAACQYDAIHIVDGVAVVDPENCIACGACAKACPKGLITMIPETSQIYVSCSSKAKGAVTRQACSVGCIACRKCEKSCPSGRDHCQQQCCLHRSGEVHQLRPVHEPVPHRCNPQCNVLRRQSCQHRSTRLIAYLSEKAHGLSVCFFCLMRHSQPGRRQEKGVIRRRTADWR